MFVFQTYVNDARLPEQEYVTLEDMDTLRFGYDILFTNNTLTMMDDDGGAWLMGLMSFAAIATIGL